MAITPKVPALPMVMFIQSLHISPTAPPQGNELLPNIAAAVTLISGKPMMRYLRFLKIENTFLLKNIFTPITNKKVQKRYEAIPKPL